MASTEQLEREAELTRAQLASSLDELRSITPGRVIDEVLGYAKSGSAELLRGIGNQVVEHPLPATLIGAGLAWLIMSNGSTNGLSRGMSYPERSRSASAESWFSETGRSASSTTEGLRERAGSAMHGMKDSAQSAMDSVGDRFDRTTDAVKERAQSLGDSISDSYGMVAEKVSSTVNSVTDAVARNTPSQDELMQAGQRIWDFCKDEPLVVAGLGIALGAAIGAAIPQTEAENRLMGEAADTLKDKAQKLVSDPLKTANDTAKSVGEKLIDEAAKLAKQEVSDLVSGWGSKNAAQSDEQSDGQGSGQEGFPPSGGDRPWH
jgi:hypothetical protein